MTVHSHAWLLCTLVLGASGLILVGGCEPSSLGQAEPMLVSQKSDIKIANSLSTAALIFNGISTNAEANKLVRSSALKDLFSSPGADGDHIRNQLMDPKARKFMEYLVSCALSPDQTLHWKSSNRDSGEWAGGVGLCTDWLDKPPSEACLTQVSSCILSRNNALNRRVELSLRGKDSNGHAIELEATASPVEYDPEVPATTGLPLESFLECTSATTGIQRNCGWSTDYIGSCTKGSPVWLKAYGLAKGCDGPVLGTNQGPEAMLRVCAGIVGCDHGGQRTLAESSEDCDNKPSEVSFSCPDSGYFNVMKAPWDSSKQLGVVSVDVEPAEQNQPEYRLPEEKVFRVREGAFYGNLFTDHVAAEVTVITGQDGGDVTVQINPSVVHGSVYPEMYVCHDPAWEDGVAYATNRVCALPNDKSNCAATVVGACDKICGTSNPQGYGDYGKCEDPKANTWNDPVTVFLNTPCDLTSADTPWLCNQ
jgi:hypothetical protein